MEELGCHNHHNHNYHYNQPQQTWRRFFNIQYGKLKRHLLWRLSFREALLVAVLIFVISQVVVPWLNEQNEDYSFIVSDEMVAEGNEPYGLNFRYITCV